ncbi:hypothetical protein OGAPHI_004331 [Ogataea philodendri]|uniref:Telomerase reverse transcriptase n=1 Tax=Ogataea philodendri TaxID=1378263 RepID=A0A9P8P6F2_9ASCO|nr:uncharacterized protein OGAPHI_004331 [Ogataea philodendri]KAH3666142.1 hypothetical protein OGAPHI_004331 [Ogataea philodendri]
MANHGSKITVTRVSDLKVPVQLIYQDCSHEELIDDLIRYLANTRSKNILLHGVVDGDRLDVSNSFAFAGPNAGTNLLKTPEFRLICTLVGRSAFLDLIINYLAQLDNQFLWGQTNESYYKIKSKSFQLKLNKMLYSEIWSLHRYDPLPAFVPLLEQIFNVPKKHHLKLRPFLEELRTNHVKRQREYPYILDSVCPEPKNANSNIDYAVDKKDVIRFLVILLEKIMPLGLFGSKHNKSVLFTKIARVLSCNKKDVISIYDLSKNFKLNDIPWINQGRKLNKMEFERAQIMWYQFMDWFFHTIVFKLVAAFFHVTDMSQSFRLLYYRHHTWHRISKQFKDRYFNKFLLKSQRARNSHETFTQNQDFIGSLRLLPKPHDLRFIAMPFKGVGKGVFERMNIHRNEVLIANMILSSKRNVKGIKSVGELPEKLTAYGKKVSGPVFALKFDIKQAYDTLPRDLLVSLIESMFENELSTSSYTINRYYLLNRPNSLGERKRRKITILDGSEKDFGSKQIVQANSPVVLNKNEVLRIIKCQLEHSAIFSSFTTFHRKRGVFQGFPLSGIFCEIVYDKVVEYLESIGSEDVNVIRLADDFLVLSTKKETITKYSELISKPIPGFNISVNREKSLFSDDRVDFLGTTIYLDNLTVTRNLRSYDLSTINVSSFKAMYSVLTQHYKVAISSGFFDSTVNSEEIIRQNISTLIESIQLRFARSQRLVSKLDKFSISHYTTFQNTFKRSLVNKLGQQYASYIDSLYPTRD